MTDDSLGRAFHDHVLGRFEYRRIEERTRKPQEERRTEDAALVH
jgi:hypothetical protein